MLFPCSAGLPTALQFKGLGWLNVSGLLGQLVNHPGKLGAESHPLLQGNGRFRPRFRLKFARRLARRPRPECINPCSSVEPSTLEHGLILFLTRSA